MAYGLRLMPTGNLGDAAGDGGGVSGTDHLTIDPQTLSSAEALQVPPSSEARRTTLSRPLRRHVGGMPTPSSVTSSVAAWAATLTAIVTRWACEWRATLDSASTKMATIHSQIVAGIAVSIGPSN